LRRRRIVLRPGVSTPPHCSGEDDDLEAPQYFTDNSSLNPATDLLRFEIYVRQDPDFGPGDNVIATASPVDTTFNLATLVPPLSRGVTYYVSVRAVTVEEEKSDFSNVSPFSFPN